MDEKDSKKSLRDHSKKAWKTVPNAIRFLGTVLGIIIAVKTLFPAAAVIEINNFDVSPELIGPGNPAVLSWNVSGASNISIEPGIGVVGANGSLSVTPSQTTTYKLIAADKGQEEVALRTVTVKEESVVIKEFNATPPSIELGENSILSWEVTGVENVTIEPEIGTVAAKGSLSIFPQETTNYKLTALGPDKEEVAFSTITVGNNLAPEEQAPVAENLTPESTLPASEDSQSQEKPQVPENLPSQEGLPAQENLPVTGSLPAINLFNAIPDLVSKGEGSSLTWSVSSATQVSIEPDIGTVSLTGSQRVFPEETTTYTLTATNEAGSIGAKKTIYVQQTSVPESSNPVPTSGQVPQLNNTALNNSTIESAIK